ncbi:MAG: ATP-binding protein, partial [SAR324 cluster bacterium]|nr:ATP-binding protein [SAR324 cluster bacterium]
MRYLDKWSNPNETTHQSPRPPHRPHRRVGVGWPPTRILGKINKDRSILNSMIENESYDQKSLRVIQCKNPNWNELAKDCVAFANAHGGQIVIGIEDGKTEPPADQTIPEKLQLDVQKALRDKIKNIFILTEIQTFSNGGQVLVIKIPFSANSVAATTSGKYFIRIGDESKPVMPESLMVLMTQKSLVAWETMTTLQILLKDCDKQEQLVLLEKLRSADADRVSPFIKAKSDNEILQYYFLTDGKYLTNLGIIWIGTREQRAMLTKVPTVQYLKYDEQGRKVRKLTWDDYILSPLALIEDIWSTVDSWKESFEISIGLFRENIP